MKSLQRLKYNRSMMYYMSANIYSRFLKIICIWSVIYSCFLHVFKFVYIFSA